MENHDEPQSWDRNSCLGPNEYKAGCLLLLTSHSEIIEWYVIQLHCILKWTYLVLNISLICELCAHAVLGCSETGRGFEWSPGRYVSLCCHGRCLEMS